ncbi:membrane-associated protein, putative [Bodo saltans]|uniref:Membrane-associated protein, putative n=1 Tax=Bodo saltans TaxID=75058 RepID=A0A0S4IPK8_BODSA|nr:membrane-associated protein, putative [Bodo saltans]|eukprot:CUE73627.1 membrane-associated protein, putative [Bodo saltans]
MSGKWRLGPLLLLAIFTIIFLTPPFIATLSREPRAQRIAIVNGARPEFLRNTLRDLVGGHDPQQRGADTVIFVFADKREYDTAASQLGGARFPVGRCDIMVAWLGCRPLQILQAFGIRKTGEIIETFASTTSTVDRCHEDGAIPSSTAALLASNSGEFLLAAAGRVLRWGADDEGLFAHDAKVVVIQPSDAVLCSGHAHASSALFATLDSCSMRDCVKLVSLGTAHPQVRRIVEFGPALLRWWSTVHPPPTGIVEFGPALLRWWSTVHPPPTGRITTERQDSSRSPTPRHTLLDVRAFSNSSYYSEIPLEIELFSPYLFIGTLQGVSVLSELVQEILIESPVPAGYPFEVILASATSRLLVNAKWGSLLSVSTLHNLDFPVGSDASICLKEHICRRPIITSDESPIALMHPRACARQWPQHAPRVSLPCHNSRRMYDDLYLLHRGSIYSDSSAVDAHHRHQQPMETIPLSLVQPQELAQRWIMLSKNTTTAAAAHRTIDFSSEPPLLGDNNATSKCRSNQLNAVLGMCGSYKPRKVRAFVNTFAKFHRRGCTKLLLFVDEERLASYHRAYGHYEDVDVISTDAFLSSLKLKNCGTNVYRVELFAAWLQQQQQGEGNLTPPYHYVMMVDTRDSVFQTDPFDPLPEIAQRVSSSLPSSSSRLLNSTAAATTHHHSPAVFLVAERFDAASIAIEDPTFFEFHEKHTSESCGRAAFHWSFRLKLSPVLAPQGFAHKRRRDADGLTPVDPLPIVCLGMLFGTYHAMQDLLQLLGESLIARIENDARMCGALMDQGMLNCLLYGGLSHAKFAHDVVLLNPYTQPYTHAFRTKSEIFFGNDAASSNNFQFLQTCPHSPKHNDVSFATPPNHDDDYPKSRPYAVAHQADRTPGLEFYTSLVLPRGAPGDREDEDDNNSANDSKRK